MITSKELLEEVWGIGPAELLERIPLAPDGSPAIGAGVTVPGIGARDYFGARVPSPPTVGFAQR